MALESVAFLLAWLPLATDPGIERSQLAHLLQMCEIATPAVSGTLHFSAYTANVESRQERIIERRHYLFSLDGPTQVIQMHNRIRDDSYPSRLICRNDSYFFALARPQDQWVLADVRKVEDIRARQAAHFTAFAAHFHSVHSVSGTPLSGLLMSTDYAVTVTKLGKRIYSISGSRRAPTGDQIVEFAATAAISKNGKYAFIGESRAVRQRSEGSVEITVLNRIAETAAAPRLLESEEISRVPGGDEVRFVRDFDTPELTTPVDRAVYYLTHYGFPEPPFDTESRPRPTNQFLWFFLLMPVGVLLLVAARSIRRVGSKTPPQPQW